MHLPRPCGKFLCVALCESGASGADRDIMIPKLIEKLNSK